MIGIICLLLDIGDESWENCNRLSWTSWNLVWPGLRQDHQKDKHLSCPSTPPSSRTPHHTLFFHYFPLHFLLCRCRLSGRFYSSRDSWSRHGHLNPPHNLIISLVMLGSQAECVREGWAEDYSRAGLLYTFPWGGFCLGVGNFYFLNFFGFTFGLKIKMIWLKEMVGNTSAHPK